MKKNYLILAEQLFIFLVFAALFMPFMMFRELAFPFVTSKAFYFRVLVEAALPLYVFFLFKRQEFTNRQSKYFLLFIFVWVAVLFSSSLLGTNPIRSLWGNFERMGGLVDFLHLVLFALYIKTVCGINLKQNHSYLVSGLIITLAVSLLLVYFKLGILGSLVAGVLIGLCGYTSLTLSETGEEAFIFLLSFIAGLLVLIGLLGKLGWQILLNDSSLPTRVSATFGNPIFFASFLVLPLALSLYYAFKTEVKWKKIYYFSVFALSILGIFLSVTRGALVAIIAGACLAGLIYWFLEKRQPAKKSIFNLGGVLILASLLVVGIFVFSNKLPVGSIKRIFTLNDSNSASRLLQWQVALKGFKDKPWLGTGAENYYVVADKYYDTKIYDYDSSWFDKPHNYFLEVLVTTGIVGFFFYLAVIFGIFYMLWKAYKEKNISALGLSILCGGFFAYNVQNLFVFDTPAAGVTFFAFAGFAWHLFAKKSVVIEKDEKLAASIPAYVWIIFGIVLIGGTYLNYSVNFLGIQSARAIGFGNAAKSVDYKLAGKYFNDAINLPFNFDKVDTYMYFSDYAAGLPVDQEASKDPDFVKQQISLAEKLLTEQVAKQGNYPLAWMRLANVRLMDDLVNKKPIEEKVEQAAQTAINLAPKRIETWQYLLQIQGYKQDWAKGVEIAKKIVELNPGRQQLKMQLAIAYKLNGQENEAVKLAEEILANGYKLMSVREGRWLVDIYIDHKEYAKAVPVLERMQQLDAENLETFFLLAEAYGHSGQKEKAILMAENIKKIDPRFAPQVDEFIQSLK